MADQNMGFLLLQELLILKIEQICIFKIEKQHFYDYLKRKNMQIMYKLIKLYIYSATTIALSITLKINAWQRWNNNFTLSWMLQTHNFIELP